MKAFHSGALGWKTVVNAVFSLVALISMAGWLPAADASDIPALVKDTPVEITDLHGQVRFARLRAVTAETKLDAVKPDGSRLEADLRTTTVIRNTGESRRLTPWYASSPTTFILFELGGTDGTTAVCAILRQPRFTLDIDEWNRKDATPEKLKSIRAITEAEFRANAPPPSTLAGIAVDSRVLVVDRDGKSFTGVVAAVTAPDMLTLLDEYAQDFQLPARAIAAIRSTGRSKRMAPSWSSSPLNYPLLAIQKNNGLVVTAAVCQPILALQIKNDAGESRACNFGYEVTVPVMEVIQRASRLPAGPAGMMPFSDGTIEFAFDDAQAEGDDAFFLPPSLEQESRAEALLRALKTYLEAKP